MTSSTAGTSESAEAPKNRATRKMADRGSLVPSRESLAKVRSGVGTGVGRVRGWLATAVWVVCLLAAITLVLGAVLVLVDANTRNSLVTFVLDSADTADLGVFSRTDGIKQFTGEGAAVKNALVNWGLGALAWVVAGRIARRLLAPR